MTYFVTKASFKSEENIEKKVKVKGIKIAA
jgi:hypothetical protein